MTWFVFLGNVAACGAFVAVAILRAKRIGGIAPWLLALLGAADAGLFMLFRVFALVSESGSSMARMDTFITINLIDTVVMYGLGFVVLAACYSLMPPVRRA